MKAVRFALTATLLCGAALSAQEVQVPRFELGLSYSGVRVNSANDNYHRTGNGGSGSIEYNLNPILGLVGDFGGYADTKKGIDDKVATWLFGPRLNWRHSRLNPYVQSLFGGAYAWNGPSNTTQNAFAMTAGGGLDYNLTSRISIKAIQVEYLMTRFDSAKLGPPNGLSGDHQNDVRYSTGVVFKFGGE
jgi:opacity protein-like surface antigen